MSGILCRIICGASELLSGGPLSALFGAWAKGSEERSAASAGRAGGEPPDATQTVAFTIGVIALAAKMAKSDGAVTQPEITAFHRLFRFAPSEAANVEYVFDLARRDTAGFESYARQIAGLFGDRHPVLEELLGCLFRIGEADGVLHEREIDYLETVAGIFGFTDRDFARMLAAHRAVSGAELEPYHVLGIPPTAGHDEIRVAYRHLVREHHPDRLIAAGMPEELVAQATSRMATINAAYDSILRQRALA